VLKNIFEGLSVRRKLSKERSLNPVKEYFEAIFNTAITTQIVLQQPTKTLSGAASYAKEKKRSTETVLGSPYRLTLVFSDC